MTRANFDSTDQLRLFQVRCALQDLILTARTHQSPKLQAEITVLRHAEQTLASLLAR